MQTVTQEANEFFEKLCEIAASTPKRASLLVHENGLPLISTNAEQSLRLRSVKKMLVGLAFARKAGSDPAFAEEMVPLDTLGTPRYYDGGAHEAWLKSLATKQAGAPSKASLEDIAHGMMRFSSNNCTEYLINRLGVDRLNALCKEYGIRTEDFTVAYDELHAPSHGTASDMIKLCEKISQEPTAVRDTMQTIAQHTYMSLEKGKASGFGKGGSGNMQTEAGEMRDLNYAWHAKQSGMNACFLTNDLHPTEATYLEERMVPFINECASNPSFRQRCAATFKGLEGVVETLGRGIR